MRHTATMASGRPASVQSKVPFRRNVTEKRKIESQRNVTGETSNDQSLYGFLHDTYYNLKFKARNGVISSK